MFSHSCEFASIDVFGDARHLTPSDNMLNGNHFVLSTFGGMASPAESSACSDIPWWASNCWHTVWLCPDNHWKKTSLASRNSLLLDWKLNSCVVYCNRPWQTVMATELFSVSITIPENPLQQKNSPFQKMLTRRINQCSVSISFHRIGSMRKSGTSRSKRRSDSSLRQTRKSPQPCKRWPMSITPKSRAYRSYAVEFA